VSRGTVFLLLYLEERISSEWQAVLVGGLCSHGGPVHTLGRMAALVPRAELSGGCAWLGPVHLQTTKE
jgi:hypothetical protein